MSTPIIDQDLTKQAPHSPRHRVAGFVIAARAVDKCRAKLAGKLGEYHYDSPLDNELFRFKGLDGAKFEEAVHHVKTYEELGAWLLASGRAKTPAEIKAWSDEMEASNPMKDSDWRSFFVEGCARLGLNPRMNTTFDWLEADDRESFRRASRQHFLTAQYPIPNQPTDKKLMKQPNARLAESPQPPVFPKTVHRPRLDPQAALPQAKKRDNTFSKSRDTREDRGSRQMKTSHQSRTFPHSR